MKNECLSTKQSEAYINEYKGNVFEFLVGKSVASIFHIEDQFYNDIPAEYLDILSKYEGKMMKLNPSLAGKLPELAMQSAEFLSKQYDKISEVYLVGKKEGLSKDQKWKEGDILFSHSASQCALSLKLCKKNSFVNTKSGGIRSFISKYFAYSSYADSFQEEMNRLIDSGFISMIHKLYDMAGLSFHGQYDQQWLSEGLSELPGELDDSMREQLFCYYNELAMLLREKLLFLANDNKKDFLSSLYSLMGLSSEGVDQLIVFHKDDHLFESFFFQKGDTLDQIKDFDIEQLSEIKSSFEIKIANRRLQLRLKPMNKFTSAALKVNCSIKLV